jgi:hypothetical protein
MGNYIIVLFKNKKKKKIIKEFITLSRAKSFYDDLIKKSGEVIFNSEFENGKSCSYEVAIITSSIQLSPVYINDDFGRNIKIKLEEDGMSISHISPYRKEETIFDIKKSKKITVQELIRLYLKGDGLKMVSVLNNKILIQEEEKLNLFTLKTEEEASRFVDCLSKYFFKIKRGDCLFIKDYSSPQRKYLYSLLESSGIDKKILYRKFTTLPQPK